MSRRGDYKSFYMLVKMIISVTIGLIFLLSKFLKEVSRLNLWGDLGKSLLIGFVYLAFAAGIAEASKDVAGLFILGGIIYFCYWWHKKLSYADTRLNIDLWQEREWWWTLNGWQFEQEVARVFRLCGYKATVTKGSGDGGVDIILKKNGYCAIVQCKHYQYPVPPEPVRALWGCKDDFGADEVILVASSGITEMGAKYVQNKPNYKVYNLDDIIIMSKQTQPQQIDNQLYDENETLVSSDKKETFVSSKYGRKLDI